MQRMLCGTENISLLLYGKPGSGKTEYAKALAKASGLKPLTQEGIRCMLDRYFHAYPFSESDIARLERRLSVTPGDFGALAGPVEASAARQNAARLAAGHYAPLPYHMLPPSRFYIPQRALPIRLHAFAPSGLTTGASCLGLTGIQIALW
ncbi:MAG: ATP-binding protein [Treponema sp.]|nr:ATP-binding protein [Treponema sp.]